jgi:hypothetical protein
MPSPYPTTALLGALLYIMRHEPESREHREALLAALRVEMGARGLRIEAEPEALRLDGIDVPLDAPGATLVSEQLRLHGVRQVDLPAGLGDLDLLRLTAVLSAFGGTYVTFEDLLVALGPAGRNITLTRGEEGLDIFRPEPWRPRSMTETVETEGVGLSLPETKGRDPLFERYQDVSIEDANTRAAERAASANLPPERVTLDGLLRLGKDAIEKEDWNALLGVALQMVEAEAEAPSQLVSGTFRIELKRLLSRKHLVMIARLAHGERKQEVIALLRRFGGDATEILMDLLVEAMSMGERRGYYSALTQMSEGTNAIIFHLDHPQWYVVRNAAELCGEMELAEAVPALARQIAHRDERVRKAVAQALAKIGTPKAAEPLRKLLDDPKAAVRLQALGAMSGRRARHMIPLIAEMLKQEETVEVQNEALQALGRIGSTEAVTLLKDWAAPGGRLLKRRPVATRISAIQALGMTGRPGAEALSALTRDDVAEVRAAATSALQAIRS